MVLFDEQKELGDETDKSSKIFRERIESLTEKVKEVCFDPFNSNPLNFLVHLVSSFSLFFQSDIGKKAAVFGEEISKQAQKAAETMSKQTIEISKTTAFKKVSEVSLFPDFSTFI